MEVKVLLEKNKNWVIIVIVVSMIVFFMGFFLSEYVSPSSTHNESCPSLEPTNCSGLCPVETPCPSNPPCPSCPDINAGSCWEDYFFNPNRKNFVKTGTTSVSGFSSNKKILTCPSNSYVTRIGVKKVFGQNFFYNMEIKCSDGSIQTDYFNGMPNIPDDSQYFKNSTDGFKEMDVSWTVEGEGNSGQVLGFGIEDLKVGDMANSTTLSCPNRIMGLEVCKLYNDAPWIGGLALVCGDFENKT